MSGAMESRELLRQLASRKDHLQDLTAGGIYGIINAGRITNTFAKIEVEGNRLLS
jgi:hypothetical protein